MLMVIMVGNVGIYLTIFLIDTGTLRHQATQEIWHGIDILKGLKCLETLLILSLNQVI
nr:holin protein Hol187 [Phietavirus pv187]